MSLPSEGDYDALIHERNYLREMIHKLEREVKQTDLLNSAVLPGDIVIRAVDNGYIIRQVPSLQGQKHIIVVAEGGLDEVAKELTAIKAREVQMAAERNQTNAADAAGYAVVGTAVPSPYQAVAAPFKAHTAIEIEMKRQQTIATLQSKACSGELLHPRR